MYQRLLGDWLFSNGGLGFPNYTQEVGENLVSSNWWSWLGFSPVVSENPNCFPGCSAAVGHIR